MNHKTREKKIVSKRRKITQKSSRISRRLILTLVVIVATAIIATGAVITRQRVAMSKESSAQVSKTAANRNYVTVKVAGQEVQVDSQTGQIKELTPEEAQKLAAGLRQSINQSSEGLVQRQEADGSVSVDLEGRFQNVTVARKNDDGSISEGCVDNVRAAGEFFGIDPQLIENPSDTSRTERNVPVPTTAPRN
jgi:hypothetical protein